MVDIFDVKQTNSNTGVQEAKVQLENATAEYELAVENAEIKLANLNHIRDKVWPDLATTLGMTEFVFSDGSVVTVKQDIYSSIKADPAAKNKAFEWLIANGLEGIIKNTISVELDKGDNERARKVVDALKPLNVHFTKKESVHPQTLAATVRSLLEDGKDVPMETLGVGVRSRAVIKKRTRI